MAGSSSSFMSSAVAAEQSQAKLNDVSSKWQENLKKEWKTLKEQDKDAKMDEEHQSSTMLGHSNTIYPRIQTAKGDYLNTANVDECSTAYEKDKWNKNL